MNNMSNFMIVFAVMAFCIAIGGWRRIYLNKEHKIISVANWGYSGWGVFNLIDFIINLELTVLDIVITGIVAVGAAIACALLISRLRRFSKQNEELFEIATEQQKLISTLTQTYVNDEGDMVVSLSGRTNPDLCKKDDCTYPDCKCHV